MPLGRVRPFTEEDIPQVAALHRTIYAPNEDGGESLENPYRSFFHEVYLDNPWYDGRIRPLVYEEGNKVSGFLGVMPRTMRMNGRTVWAAVSSMFMVHPDHRLGLAAVHLMKTFLSGPQDLSLADESTTSSRKLWERLGGLTCVPYSIYWTRVLKPTAFLTVRFGQHWGTRALTTVSRPFCSVADAALSRIVHPFYRTQPRFAGEDLDVRALLEYSSTLWEVYGLRPDYDEQSLAWLLDLAGHAGAGGSLRTIAVRNADLKVVGWYVYYLTRERIAEVLQVGFQPSVATDVLDHLFHHASDQGAVAVTGRLDQRLIQDLGGRYLMNPRYWMLIHSKRPELLHAIDHGTACLSRLEGEWCMQFHQARYRAPQPASWTGEARERITLERAAAVKVERGGVEVIELLADEWRSLCEESTSQEPFYRPEWIAAYVRAFDPHARVVLISARVGGVLKAVLPLIEERAFAYGVPARKLRSATNAHCCRFDIVRSGDRDGDAAATAVWRHLSQMPGWDLIELSDVPEGGGLDGIFSAARADGFPVGRRVSLRTPYITLSGLAPGKDPLFILTSANLRSNVRRKALQLKAQGQLTLRRIDKADPRQLEAFYRLEASGWKGEEGTAIQCNPQTRQFYDEIAREAERFGYLSLFFLDFNGHPIAAQFGITHAGRYFMPKFAFDEHYRRYGPGHLLIHAILKDLIERGISEYDFTGPWAEYKGKWSSTNRIHHNLWIFNKGPAGHLLHAMKFKVEYGVKEVLRPIIHAARKHGKPIKEGAHH